MSENKDYITRLEEKGSVNISGDVIASVVAAAALEVNGVAGLAGNVGNDIAQLFANKKIASGVKLDMEGEELVIDVNILLTLGTEVSPAAVKVQNAVIEAVEDTTGIKVAAVNVHVSGISLK